MITQIIERSTDKGVVILSSPRTGSTVLGSLVSIGLNCDFFSELVEPGIVKNIRMQQFLFYKHMNKQYVLKEHTLLFADNYKNVFDENSTVFIRLRRKDIFKQTLSTYISNFRNIWSYERDNTNDTEIMLDKKKLLDTKTYVDRFNQATDNYRGKLDFDLYFEDLDLTRAPGSLDNGNKHDTIPSVKPKNYSELTEWAKDILRT